MGTRMMSNTSHNHNNQDLLMLNLSGEFPPTPLKNVKTFILKERSNVLAHKDLNNNLTKVKQNW